MSTSSPAQIVPSASPAATRNRAAAPLRVLVVGQTPPPFHGQAIMIERLLKCELAGIRFFHVRMAFAQSMADLGRFRLAKVWQLIWVILQIYYYRLAHGARVLYYPPSGPNRNPVYRDMLVLLTTRWMFAATVLHFHAGGTAEMQDRLPRWLRPWFRRAFGQASAAIRLSELTPEDGALLGARREFIVPYGIDDGCLSLPSDLTAETREPATADDERPLRLLYVGIVCESKGALDLVEACGRLNVPFELDIVGGPQSAAFQDTLEARIRQLGLTSQVHLHGVLTGDAKLARFAAADLFCFPSFYECEAFPIVLLEALCFGLPIVSTTWRGIPAIVQENRTGFLVSPRDIDALVARLELLAADRELRERFGEEARADYLARFTGSRFAEKMQQLLLDVGETR